MTSLALMLGTLAAVAAVGLSLVAVLGHTARAAKKAEREADHSVRPEAAANKPV